ncbi:MAG: MazG nucleotide pyrophosphohydrolase domain-containing protein [Patescibacteria group bacterium]
MPELKQNPILKDFQDYVIELEKERGFTEQTVLQRSLLLGEEVGELFKAIRKLEKMGVDQNSKIDSVDEELADVLISVCSIANRFGIDLEQAFRDKEEINKKRTWN